MCIARPNGEKPGIGNGIPGKAEPVGEALPEALGDAPRKTEREACSPPRVDGPDFLGKLGKMRGDRIVVQVEIATRDFPHLVLRTDNNFNDRHA